MKSYYFWNLCLCLGFVMQGMAQQQTFQRTDKTASVTVKGTSTLHDWTVTAEQVSDFPTKITIEFKEGQNIQNFAFKVKTTSLDGGRGAAMNSKIKKALKATTHPYIKYQQTKSAKIGNVDTNGNFTLVSNGVLEIAGIKKAVSVKVAGKLVDNRLVLSGSKALKMTDFKIKPPTAMFGQIKTKDDITVNFEFTYVRSDS